MSNKIPTELQNFKKNVSSNISNMENVCNNIEQKTQECISNGKTIQSTIDNSYSSENKQEVMTRFEDIDKIYNLINTSVSTDLKTIISNSKELINKITELEDLNNNIETQEAIINRENRNTPEGRSKILDAREQLDSVNNEFNTKLSTALEILNKLKSSDSNIDFTNSFSPANENKESFSYGSFELKEFVSSNGYKINYYVYVPETEDTEGLPVHMYLHGTGEMGNQVLKRGLPMQLANKELSPNGIVICPQTTKEELYYNEGYRDALVELSQSVTREYNGDPNKISLSGHSSGAILTYNLVKKYPNTFSAIVPISGGEYLKNEDTNAFKDVKVWAFHGDKDPHTMRSNYSNVINRTLNPLINAGLYAYLTTLNGRNHDIQNDIFTTNYEDINGNSINPLEWAMEQTRA